jgi:predicted transcriptional regulator
VNIVTGLSALKKQLIRINQNECVLVDGVLRNKATLERYRVTKKMLSRMLFSGLIKIDPGGVTLTDKGRDMVLRRGNAKKSAKQRYRDRRQRGYHRMQVWVHEEDLDRFRDAMRVFSDDR